MQAAIGVEQLKKLPGFIEKRKENFNWLYQGLKKYEDYFVLPEHCLNSDPSWFGFPLLSRDDAPFSRDDIVRYLEANKIATRMLFGGNLAETTCIQRYTTKKYPKNLENTDIVMHNCFWLGVYPGITKTMLKYCNSVFDGFFHSNNSF